MSLLVVWNDFIVYKEGLRWWWTSGNNFLFLFLFLFLFKMKLEESLQLVAG